MKKLIVAILIVLLIALAGFIAYLYLTNSQTNQPTSQAPAVSETASTSPTGLFPSGDTRNLTPVPITNGNLSASTSAPVGGGNNQNNQTGNQVGSRFNLVSAGPIADLALLAAKASSTLWYIEKGTGHLYQIDATGAPVLFTNTTIPAIQALTAAQTKTGPKLIVTYNKDGQNQNLLAAITATTTAGNLAGKLLPGTASQFIISPDRNTFAYLDTAGNKNNLVTSDWDQKKTTTIFTSPLAEWRLGWLATTTIVLTTKPSSQAAGFSYLFDLKTSQLTRLINEVPALEVLPAPNGYQVLYSGVASGVPFLALYDLKKQQVSRLGLSTIVDKCAWSADSSRIYCGAPTTSPAGNFPDNWFSGELATSDRLWQITAASQSTEMVFNPALQNSSLTLDVAKLAYDQAANRLYILNKTDFSLWALDLSLGF